MEKYTRTDLACESYREDGTDPEGTEESVRETAGFRIREFRVVNEKAAVRIGKPIGRYITLECGRIDRLEGERAEIAARLLAGELRGMTESLCQKPVGEGFGVFVAGLGNAELTADAIGPETVRRLTATRHLREHEARLFHSLGCAALSALSPGVLGQTGIETGELLRGAVECVRPDAAVIVDALAARSCDRLASTVQLSDAGIVPGSGVGNHRSAVTMATIGVPVVALGVPTVVDSSTLVYDALRKADIGEISDSLREVLENGRSFFVSPKESDVITERVSALLARAVTLAFLGDVEF